MKMTILEGKEKRFTPIVVKLVLENEQEARSFWHILNASTPRLIRGNKDYCDNNVHKPLGDLGEYAAWDAFDDLIKEREIEI
jgi:hypothetical protein